MRTINFEKWEGIGNDFIVVREDELPASEAASLAAQLCNRRTGIGGDGVLITGLAPPSMIVINADGSRPEMCGNGIRCAAAAIANWNGTTPTVVESDAGPRPIVVLREEDGYTVEVDMGIPSFNPADAGVEASTDTSGGGPLRTLEANGKHGTVVSVGNPHWVFLDDTPEPIEETGPPLENDPRFAQRTNVEWVQQLGPNWFRVDVWERGSGRTMACGTGATGVAAVLRERKLTSDDEPVRITLPGGDLLIRFDDEGTAWMRGAARHVYSGVITLPRRQALD